MIQRVVPTRTGYNAIKSEVVVWLSAVNFTTTLREDDVIQKPWTDEDHWTMYKNEQDYIYKEAAKAHENKMLHQRQRHDNSQGELEPTILTSRASDL